MHQCADGRRDWLRISDGNGVVQTLPATDPYREIYENQTDWWRLIDKTLLNPVGEPEGTEAFRNFKKQIGKARKFHNDLEADPFHPNVLRHRPYDNSAGRSTRI